MRSNQEALCLKNCKKSLECLKGNNVIGFACLRGLLCLQCGVWNSAVQECATGSYDHNPVRDDRSWAGMAAAKEKEMREK